MNQTITEKMYDRLMCIVNTSDYTIQVDEITEKHSDGYIGIKGHLITSAGIEELKGEFKGVYYHDGLIILYD